MKYLNAHKAELFEGKKVTYRGKVYWVDAEISGDITGYKVADIFAKNGAYEIVKA